MKQEQYKKVLQNYLVPQLEGLVYKWRAVRVYA